MQQPLSYNYQDLPDEDGMRLLVLEAGGPEDKLRCSLTITRLSAQPRYAALSYTWGDHRDIENVDCDGYSLKITQGLGSALRRSRDTHEAVTLWVDAICINQKDIAERNVQVMMMSRIYFHAEEVLVWLGDDPLGHAALAFQSIERYLEQNQNQAAKLSQVSGKVDYRELDRFYGGDPAHMDNKVLDAVVDILTVPWFSRVWVLQEVGVAARATAFCGNASTPFENLVSFAAVTGYISGDFSVRTCAWKIRDAYDCIWATYELSSSWRDRMPLQYRREGIAAAGFVDILLTTLHRKATDKRDLVYSMLGHPYACIRGTTETLVKPDYYISFEKLSSELTRALLAKNHDLTILSLIQHQSQRDAMKSPSWIPNLELANQVIDHVVLGLGAGGSFSPSVGLQSDRLELSGLFVDDVDWASEPLRKSDLGYDEHGNYIGSFSCAVPLIKQHLENSKTAKKSLPKYHLESLAVVLTCRALKVPVNFSTQHAREQEIKRLARGLEGYLALVDAEDKGASPSQDPHPDILHFSFWASRYCSRSFFSTTNGYWGLGPSITEPGDKCFIFFGSRVPSVVRPVSSSGGYKFIGECYIYGLMEGEGVGAWKAGKIKAQDRITLY